MVVTIVVVAALFAIGSVIFPWIRYFGQGPDLYAELVTAKAPLPPQLVAAMEHLPETFLPSIENALNAGGEPVKLGPETVKQLGAIWKSEIENAVGRPAKYYDELSVITIHNSGERDLSDVALSFGSPLNEPVTIYRQGADPKVVAGRDTIEIGQLSSPWCK